MGRPKKFFDFDEIFTKVASLNTDHKTILSLRPNFRGFRVMAGLLGMCLQYLSFFQSLASQNPQFPRTRAGRLRRPGRRTLKPKQKLNEHNFTEVSRTNRGNGV